MDSDVKKRRAARQKRIRQRRMLITFFVFLAIGFITVIIMCFTTFFPIKQAKVVQGSKIYSNQQIIDASRLVSDKKQLFSISQKSLEKTIRSKLPYVENVTIDRKFPDTVNLKVTDAKEESFFKSGNKYYILSTSDRVVKTDTKAPQNIFEIVTKNGISGKLGEKIVYKEKNEEKLVKNIMLHLKENGLKINKIDVKNIAYISLRVEDKFDVNIGRNENLERKIAHLATMTKEIGDRSGSINLSAWSPNNKEGSFIEK